MKTVTVDLADRSYDVLVGAGAREWLPSVLPSSTKRAAIVTQASIGFSVHPGVEHETFFIGEGEAAKTIATVEGLCREWARWNLTRADVVIAVGGGVVTDTAGFAAAVYHRGVAWCTCRRRCSAWSMPPSAARRVSISRRARTSSVRSGNHPQCCATRTHSRHFHQRELRSGMGEMAKYHFLGGADLMSLPLDERVAECVRIKAAVVSSDERESGPRALLNYGHTLAHSLESAGRYDLRHGEAVAIGLVFAAELAHTLGRIDDERVAEHRHVVGSYDLPLSMPPNTDPVELIRLFGRDKKAVDGITFVLDGPDGLETVAGVGVDALEQAFARIRTDG